MVQLVFFFYYPNRFLRLLFWFYLIHFVISGMNCVFVVILIDPKEVPLEMRLLSNLMYNIDGGRKTFRWRERASARL